MVTFFMKAAGLVLREHYLEFEGQVYRQIRGTAMGCNFAVVFACLFLCTLELDLFHSLPSEHLFDLKRFIDDGFGVWTGSEASLLEWLNAYNNRFPSI